MGDEQDSLAWDAAALDPLFQSEVSDIEAAYRCADSESWVET